MRERLALAFAAVALAMVGLSFVARSFLLTNNLRQYESNVLHAQVGVAAGAVRQRELHGDPVDRGYLATLVPGRTALVYHVVGHPSVRAAAPDYHVDETRALIAVHDTARGTLILEADPGVIRGLLFPDWAVSVLTIVVLVLLSAGVGWLVARWLARPFQVLAEAAADLGRGRFELHLPRSEVGEVKAVSQALEDSAGQIRARITYEQALAEHTSHALRTPLTALRLELEDLGAHEALPPDVASVVERSIGRIERLDGVTGELVALTRGPGLVGGAEITLRELATTAAQRWADELGQQGRTVTAGVEGDLETTYTPGPVEQILDLVLLEAMRRAVGPVRLVFEGDPDAHLLITVEWTRAPDRPDSRGDDPLVRATAVATALGGRLNEAPPGLSIRLPRR